MKGQEEVFALLRALSEPRKEYGAASCNLDLQARFSHAFEKRF